VHEPALTHRRPATGRVDEPHLPAQDAAAQVQRLGMVQHLHPGQVDPVVVDGEAQIQPVRQVDDALVLDHPATDLVAQAVVAPRRIGTRVVHTVG
jgi:hypothetical protein